MYVPRARERVQIIGRSGGVFIVVRIDERLQVADLFPLHSGIFIEKGVPFSDLKPYQENPGGSKDASRSRNLAT